METRDNTRRLVAILAADVAGYSRLMHEDEEATIAAWQSARRDIIDPVIAAHDGRIVKHTGDGFLAEFATVTPAVKCAVDLQGRLSHSPLDFRIGINLGEIVADADDIHGDGVNIAARLEGMADPGGICISGSVYDQVHNKIDLGYDDLGEQRVKNIDSPVRVYRVQSGEEAGAPSHSLGKSGAGGWKAPAIAAAVCVLIAALGIGLWWPRQTTERAEPVKPETTATIRTVKPSIAVLPFVNMSSDQEQEYFSDGLTEDLITDISKVSGVRVIARNSTFSYKGQSPDVRAVGKALGATHIVEGSVRKAGGTVRITVQLIDAADGNHIWAERYDRELKDIFAVQDEVIGQIIAMLSVKLTSEEKTRIARKGTDNLEAYDLLMRGRQQESFFNQAANAKAVEFFKRAIALDPNYAEANAHLSIVNGIIATFGRVDDIKKSHAESLELAEKAVSLNTSLPLAHFALGRILSRPQVAEYPRAIEAFRKAIQLNPNHADSYANLAFVSIFTGDAKGAHNFIGTAMRMNPHFPFWYLFARAMAYYLLGEYASAVEDLSKANERNPTVVFVRYWLAAALAQAGRVDDAEWQVEELRAMGYTESRDVILKKNPITFSPYKESLKEGLRKAGFK